MLQTDATSNPLPPVQGAAIASALKRIVVINEISIMLISRQTPVGYDAATPGYDSAVV
jgi:hypothetical protein